MMVLLVGTVLVVLKDVEVKTMKSSLNPAILRSTEILLRAPSVVTCLDLHPVFRSINITEPRTKIRFPRHVHTRWEILLVQRGELHNEINGEKVVVRAGEGMIVQPGDIHRDGGGPPLLYIAVIFHFHEVDSSHDIDHLLTPNGGRVRTFKAPKSVFGPLQERLISESRESKVFSHSMQDAILLELFWAAVRELPGGGLSGRSAANSRAVIFAERLTAFFDANLARQLPVSEMASAMHVSRSLLTSLCKSAFGCSPAHAFLRRRMEHAMELLDTTDHPIKEISYHLGFRNPFHFSRNFKQTYGHPPIHYRCKQPPPVTTKDKLLTSDT